MTGIDLAGMVEEARVLGQQSESLRQKQLAAARHRQDAIWSLHVSGLSIRDLAGRLGCSPAVIQSAIKAARYRRPRMPRREERIPFELHVQLGLKLHENEQSIREIGRAGIERMRQRPRNPIAEKWLDRWTELLDLPLGEFEAAMLEDSPMAKELRQMSPFAGALTQGERVIAIKKAAALAT
ncbi:hypothetical protein [Pseudarthrobacter cellobiosi]|uniref:hypothetical protein n=1 Tax=Pseudarthrobacter cellobiosi TaxID=2953654 RepID=UPI00208EAEB1|nr:hypothetical protein [Pseudarthrobacter sp. HLT1-5]MCO4254818.1 hypothetical protein [Pseudarthrobacter sp. HLT1-5]